ncbi:MAG: glycosyltransferase [Alphaproteobacteria bacterium]|nr:glycosyltransferase [Alphaproteobacteria bacterium]
MKTFTTIVCLLIPFPGPRRRLRTWLKCKFPPRPKKSALHILRRYVRKRNVILWFDHSLGGGTETYSLRQFNELKNSGFAIIRIQYFPWCNMYGLSAPNHSKIVKYMVPTLAEVQAAVGDMRVIKIVVNNLVGYPKSTEVLDYVAALKAAFNAFVSFRAHDFQSICPSFNLINCDGEFCNFTYPRGCEECWRNKRLGDCDRANEILRSGAESVAKWRQDWGRFFSETVDEIIVFSKIIGEMFARIYPQLANKTVLVPHFVPTLRKAVVSPHDGINIACLGNMLPVKGRDVIIEMCRHIPDYENVNITIIGDMEASDCIPANLTVLGQYDRDNLPAIIERYKIDIIFIPSIWPETFSYTTAEAMSMNLPVVCYNMGAPAERVGAYRRGLVLREINPQRNLQEIITFVRHLKKEN